MPDLRKPLYKKMDFLLVDSAFKSSLMPYLGSQNRIMSYITSLQAYHHYLFKSDVIDLLTYERICNLLGCIESNILDLKQKTVSQLLYLYDLGGFYQ